MNFDPVSQTESAQRPWSWERWAALLAFVVAELVRAGAFKQLPW
jgi:hypothetical protein